MSVEEAAKTASGGFMPWVPWIAIVVVAGLAGGGIGASGLVGHETQNVVEFGAVGVAKTTPAYSCPGGAAVSTLNRGERVLALGRSDDATWVSVRDPRSLGTTVWVPVGLVVVDAGEGAIPDLPLGDPCPTVSLPPGDAPAPVEEAAPGPAPAPEPAPGGDTSAPSVGGASASNASICYTGSGFSPTTSVVSVTATDNVGVASVTATWSAVGGSPKSLSASGNTWSFTFSSPPVGANTPVQITLTARDAAGNSASTTTTVTVLFNSPPCQLI